MPGPKYFAVDDAAARQNWEKELHYTTVKQFGILNPAFGFIGEGRDKLIQVKSAVFEKGGTRATITLLDQGSRVTLVRGNEVLEGKENGVDSPTFQFDINMIRFAKMVDGEITENRVEWNVMNELKDLLADDAAKILEFGFMSHLTGFTINADRSFEPEVDGSDLARTLNNAPVAFDSYHFYRPNGHTTDAQVAANSAAILDFDDISKIKTRARMMRIPIRPVYCEALKRKCYVLFVSPTVTQYWKQEGSSAYRLAVAELQGGNIDKNRLVTGAAGFYDDTLIVESAYMPPGIDGTSPAANTRRFAFCGAQAGVLGTGRNYRTNKPESMFQMIKNVRDYGDKVGVGVKCIIGADRPIFSIDVEGTGTDMTYGVIAGTSYAEDAPDWT